MFILIQIEARSSIQYREYNTSLPKNVTFSKGIWDSFNEKENQLNIKQMTQLQRTEFNYIDELTSNLIIKEFVRKTRFEAIRKRIIEGNCCYVVNRKCLNSSCDINWKICIYIDKWEVSLSQRPSVLCNHYTSNGKISKI